jgi:uncharacterized protein (DUF885 family)
MNHRHHLALLCLAALALPAALPVAAQSASAPAASASPAAKALHTLFARDWQRQAERFPEFATFRGDYRYNDRLSDASAEAEAADWADLRRSLAEAKAIAPESLDATDRVSRELFIRRIESTLALEPYAGYRSLSLGSLWGLQSALAGLLQQVPMARTEHAEQLLRRLAAYPKRMDQEIDKLRRGMATGWVTPRPVLERALAQLDGQVNAEIEVSPFYAPFKRLGGDIPDAERTRLQAAGRAAVERDVLPPMKKLRAFIVDEYLPKAPVSGAFLHYPGGKAVYDTLVQQQTTTALTAAEVHAIGLREMARIRAEMAQVQKQVKFEGDFAAFVKHLHTDPKFYATSPEDMLARYRDITKRIDAEMPRLFAELPRAPYGVRAMPAHLGPSAADNYTPPALDGSRAGWFNANVLGFKARPIWSMPSLAAHEAVPGHHLQNARSQELGALPEFRRGGWGYTAYGEGWALYAETLGREIGLYDDPYALFGHLQWQALRAARLVVDTGIHAQGWSRQQAIDYMTNEGGIEIGFASSEVDRYTANPGQALAYMIGQLKIIELRDRAKAKLGAKFDLRRFHNAVLDNGALPLTTLETLIDAWIAGQAG